MSKDVYRRESRALRRVVVTGLGAVTPLGLTAQQSWEAAINGQSGVGAVKSFDASDFVSQIGGEVHNFDTDLYVNKKDQKKMDRFIHFAMATADMAIDDSGLIITEENAHRIGCFVGVGMGGLPVIEKQHEILFERGPSRISPFFIPAVITNLASGQITIKHGLRGPNYSVTSACASGNHSIGEAANHIRLGLSDVMLAGGSESCICPMAYAGFGNMRALSTRNSHPEMASRPWDKDRDGFVVGEGAGMLILEDYEHAMKRGAKIYAELRGYGASSDAYHMTTPSPGGAGAALAMENCIKDAEVNKEDIQYINAHGTSTPQGDAIETEAVKRVFGEHAKTLWMSSTKSMTGHTLGAAGAIESMFSVMSLYKGVAPPTINLDNPSDDCDLDYVPSVAREKTFSAVLNNSFGFGGTNACLLFTRI